MPTESVGITCYLSCLIPEVLELELDKSALKLVRIAYFCKLRLVSEQYKSFFT